MVDEKAGITPHSRITSNLKAELVAACGDMSYEKATDHLSRFNQALKFSRQTACSCVKEFEAKPMEVPVTKRKVDELYVEADEDHLKINGRSAQARLVYFHEGVAENPRRHLVKAKYFTTVQKKPDEFWYEILDHIDAHYDLDSMQKLYLSGDGANWIKSGQQYLPNSTFILDQFHLFQAIRTATAHAPELAKEVKRGMRQKDRQHVMKHLARALELADEEPRQKRLLDIIKYIENNWRGIENGVNNPHVNCSAEGHVSHILSARLSSRPMSWSKQGAEKMASIRSIRANGESVQEHYLAKCPPAPVISELKSHAKRELEQLRRHRQKLGRQGLNNAPVYSGGSNPTRKALKGLNSITAF